MKAVFADAAFYIAVINRRDEFHDAAKRLAVSILGQIVTTEYVLLEVGNFLARSPDRCLFVELVEALQADADTTIISASPEWWRRGFAIYGRRADKHWSLTDCISFEVMQDKDLTEVLTGDHHFEQAGFTILLK